MDLTSENSTEVFSLAVVEAIELLVDSHDPMLDKRAAMMTVVEPTFNQDSDRIFFDFKIKGNRQKPIGTRVYLDPQVEDDDQEYLGDMGVALIAAPECSCSHFTDEGQCQHSLAASWWLQEQLGKRSISNVLEFFTSLKPDPLAAGREMISKIFTLADDVPAANPETAGTRLQWRIQFSNSRYYSPISISAYEQRPRKSGKGWTKGREVRAFDLMRRDFGDLPADGRIAALVSSPTYSFEGEHFGEMQALQMMVGHPNIGWGEGEGSPVEVLRGHLVLTLEPIALAAEEADKLEPGQEDAARMYRPRVDISGLGIDRKNCEIVLAYSSPVDPMVVFFDKRSSRLVLCELENTRATPLVEYLLRNDTSDLLIDAETAAKFSVGSARVDSLIRVELPAQLAGPIEDVPGELVFDLRPRPGAGLFVSLSMHEERYREPLVPGHIPAIVSCLTPEGPIRLKRDLTAEKETAEAVADRFSLNLLSAEGAYRWVAESDVDALEMLSRLYAGGDETPRLIWPEGETIRIRGEITPSSLRVQIDDRKDWFGLTGSISLDGKEVQLAEILAAVRENRSLVQVGDREFAKISDAFRKRLQLLGDAVVPDRGSLRVADAAVPAVQDLIGDDVPIEATARWFDSIKRLESLADWTPEKPENLDVTFRDYQLDGYQWLARLSRWGVGGVLADDMGLGKTVQTLGVLLDRAADGPALVVAPTSVGDNWVRESERFSPDLNPLLYRESDREQLVKSADAGDLVIVSYQLLQRDAKRFTSRVWNTLVLDEAQFIKNAQTKTSQAIRKIDADWRIGLSGTPLENHLGELWSLFRTLSPGLLGSWERFRSRFAEPIERHKDDDARESLARLVRPFILRRTKNKVLTELPPRTEVTLQAELSGAERQRYEDARLAAVAELSGVTVDGQNEGDRRIRTLAWLTRLRQLSCHPQLVDKTWTKSSAKLDLFATLVDELREGDHRALVFSQFVKHLGVVRRMLDEKGIKYQYLDGSTPAKERQRRVDAFQNGEGELFLISLKAGGTGLNLTAADYVIHLDPWWNPAVEDQATDRAHRIGQERPVTVYRLVAKGTIEERILEMHANKRELVAGVLDGADRAAKLNTDDLISLIKEGASDF